MPGVDMTPVNIGSKVSYLGKYINMLIFNRKH
jgi:hypothetical protein